jgi:hypothetical protein
VISTTTNTVIGPPISVGNGPVAFGLFIQPARKFAGTPGRANCHGQSVRALGQKFDGLDAAATALGYRTVPELQSAITTFCEGSRFGSCEVIHSANSARPPVIALGHSPSRAEACA